MDALTNFFIWVKINANDAGVHIGLIIAGMVGAFVKMGKKEELNFWQRLLTLLAGGAIANYVTPLVFYIINIPQDMHFGFAFLFGFSGVEGVKWMIFTLKKKYSKD